MTKFNIMRTKLERNEEIRNFNQFFKIMHSNFSVPDGAPLDELLTFVIILLVSSSID